ncbi:pullulanase /isoamylase [Singulisphaera sp. GP187]|uniref:glycoside hydrolase family 13 protein n=1 Tax=Singulisphaera sp. GP187 TaxID=1882752 RepID=UPI000929AA41|nr:glycoside hydrolase family 13 protein [Singulisphaera sp. GP187]SIO03561.1 pullulanase /isoamylase [Singulisphaera sp. GP187]
MSEPQTPDWVRDAIFYQIFPDRFARSLTVPKPSHLDEWGSPPTYHGYQGGDLIGVVERLDYLAELGVNALYFTPVFQSASNHRYHTHDYERVDPMLGGNAALSRLLEEAHGRGMKVVLDGVFNHASRGFFQFHDILENGANAAYLDWFTVHRYPLNAYDSGNNPGYQAWWNLPALPKFNIRNPEVREFLLGIGRKWIDMGIDGWRLDVANEIDDDSFWQEFRRRVHGGNPDAYIVGEVWGEAKRWLQGDMWDAVMNYLFTRACIAFFIGESVDRGELGRTSFHSLDPIGAPAFRHAIETMIGHYHPNVNAAQMNLLDSHDMPRFLTLAQGDKSALRLATLFQMTYTGAPSIYYGDEIGMPGKHDPDNRRAFPWYTPESWDRDLLHDFQRYIALRRNRPALRRGSFQILLAQDDVLAHARQLGPETVVIAINTSRFHQRIDIPLAGLIPEGTGLDEVWTHEVTRSEGNTLRGIELAPRSGRVFATPLPS